MRILTLTSSYPKYPGDGTAPFIERIVRSVAKRGHAVDVVLPSHPQLVTRDRDGGLPLRFFPFYAGPSKRPVWGYATSMEADRRLRGAALAFAPIAFLSALAALRRRLASERYDLIHAHWVLPSGAIAALAASRAGLPLVTSLHGSDVFVAERSAALGAIARRVLRRRTWVNACSRDLAERARSLAGGIEHIEILPYGVDVEALAAGDPSPWRSRAGADEGQFLIVGLGRLVAKKGFACLIRAVARLRAQGVPVRLALGGTGDLASALADEARREGCAEIVRLLGDVPHHEVGAFLRAADVVAVPSVRDESGNVDGLPNVLLEALAAGRPVVSSSVGGIPDVITHERNGLLVQAGEDQDLATALGRLRNEPGLRRRLAEEAMRTARGLSWEAYGERLCATYEKALPQEAARAN